VSFTLQPHNTRRNNEHRTRDTEHQRTKTLSFIIHYSLFNIRYSIIVNMFQTIILYEPIDLFLVNDHLNCIYCNKRSLRFFNKFLNLIKFLSSVNSFNAGVCINSCWFNFHHRIVHIYMIYPAGENYRFV